MAVPLDPAQWIEERKFLLSEAFRAASEAARLNTLPNGIVKEGVLQMSKLERQTPEDADRLVLDLYREIPMTRITDVLLQSDQGIGFTETAPYILDGLVSNVTGRGVKEQFSDTGGFSDHVFAMCSILGYSFIPRIRDLPAKRLYAFEPNEVDEVLRPMVAATIREDLIMRSWSDVLQPGFRPTRTKAP